MLAFWVQHSALKHEIMAVEEKHLLLARNLTVSLERYAWDVEAGFQLAASQLEQREILPGVPGLLRSLKLRQVVIVDQEGVLLGFQPGHSQPLPPLYTRKTFTRLAPWIEEALATPSEAVFTHVMTNEQSQPALFLVQALSGNLLAFGELGLDYITELQRAVAFGKKGHAAIVDNTGRLLAHPNPEWQANMRDISSLFPVREMKNNRTGTAIFFSPVTEVKMITGYTVVPKVGWGVMVPQPYEELVERVGDVQRAGYTIAGVGILLSILIGWGLARYLSRPIEAVAASAREVASGMLQSRVPVTGRLAPRELEDMTDSFNRMIMEIEQKTVDLVETAMRLADAQRIARMGYWEWNIAEKTLWWSDEAYELFGFSPGAVEPNFHTFLERVHPEERERVREEIIRCSRERKPFEMIHRVLLFDGTERIISHRAKVTHPGDGTFSHMSGTLHDITEQVQSEKLRESEEHFRSLVGQAADAFFLLDAKGIIVDVNQRACDDLLYSREELLNLSLTRITEGMGIPNFRNWLESMLPGEPLTVTASQVRADGERFPVEIKTGAIDSDGGRLFLAVVRDISERKVLEDRLMQSQKMEAIGRLAGGIAHDFNNTLQPILGYTELAMEKLDPESGEHKYLAIVQKAALRAKDIVSQILVFSRKSESRPEVISLTPLISDTLKLLESTLSKNIRVYGKLSEHPIHVSADVTQIHQVLLNLCINAGQAMPDGGDLTVGLESVNLKEFVCYSGHTLSGEYARLSISDSGMGMDKATIDHIFEPFFTTKPVGQGTGLGLSSVLGIIIQHEGAVNIHSIPEVGTTFEVYLRQVKPPRRRKAKSTRIPSPLGKMSILLVDDEEAITDLAEEVLGSRGHRVMAFNESPLALEAFKANPGKFDLVISDQMMPVMTGEELVSALREIRADIPVILCTGFSDALTPNRVRELGVEALFEKPVSSVDLLEMVGQIQLKRNSNQNRKKENKNPPAKKSGANSEPSVKHSAKPSRAP